MPDERVPKPTEKGYLWWILQLPLGLVEIDPLPAPVAPPGLRTTNGVAAMGPPFRRLQGGRMVILPRNQGIER
jgi:hypothetical protein